MSRDGKRLSVAKRTLFATPFALPLNFLPGCHNYGLCEGAIDPFLGSKAGIAGVGDYS
jgi:hypothetical protein